MLQNELPTISKAMKEDDSPDLPVRKKLPHGIPQWVDERSFYFITICCVPRWENQLCHSRVGQGVLDSVDFYHQHLRWHCLLFLLMPDHAHGIICFPRDEGMKPLIRSWKRYAARTWKIEWQSDFFDHRLRSRVLLEEKVSYILNNPLRAGLCGDSAAWPYVYHPMDRLL